MILKTKLFDHQQRAFSKLSKIKVGAAYMEMGTGKTRVALELIEKRFSENKIEHVLWLCPCSVKENLKRDIIKHTGEELTDLITICGIETLSSSIKANIKLIDLVESKNCFLIVDESNLVKNHKAIRTRRITDLAEKCKYKLILNGTPLSRNEQDLFSQWYILDWRILGYKSFYSFSANHIEYDEMVRGKVRRTLNTDYLVEKIAPYSYQVKKSECLDLPEKTYDTIYYSLTKEQDEHYQKVADKLLFEVDELEPTTIYRLFTGLQNVISGFRVFTDGPKLQKELFFKNRWDNPRVQKLLEVVEQINEKEKIIIFCKYTQEIKDVIEVLTKKYGEGAAVEFTGEVNQKNRQKNILKFMNESRFFIANKECGAYGLNLQFCSYIIYYSNDWDYATRSQSEDRVHRIGQHNNVHIIDICAAYTLDESILKCLTRKENLVESFKNELDRTKDKEELFAWIQRKDYRGKKYCKKVQSIDKSDLVENSK